MGLGRICPVPWHIVEFPLDIRRQGRALCGHLVHKRGIVLLDERVEESLFRTVAFVTVNAMVGLASLPAGRCNRIACMALPERCLAI